MTNRRQKATTFHFNQMDKNNGFALVRKSSSAVEKAAPGAKRILSGMVADAHALAKNKELKKLRIVVLDDEPMFFDIYEHFIRKCYKDATVLKFNNGDQVWQELLRAEPDLLITDINHLGLNGREMLPLLERKKVRFPILVVSGNLTGKEVQQYAGSELNVSFLSKPFDNEILTKLLETALKSPRNTQPTKPFLPIK
jgi:response regulator RpfG family c-di-GMP phosphodiesterase